MPAIAGERLDLFSQQETALVLHVTRGWLSGYAEGTRLAFRRHPKRKGQLLSRRDIEKIARLLGVEPDWDRLER